MQQISALGSLLRGSQCLLNVTMCEVDFVCLLKQLGCMDFGFWLPIVRTPNARTQLNPKDCG